MMMQKYQTPPTTTGAVAPSAPHASAGTALGNDALPANMHAPSLRLSRCLCRARQTNQFTDMFVTAHDAESYYDRVGVERR